MPYMFQTFLSFLYEKNWWFLFYCRKYFVICSKFRAVSLFLSTARIRFYLIRAVEIFLSSSWHFQKKCRAVEIRAVAFRAVDPDSLFPNILNQNNEILLLFYVWMERIFLKIKLLNNMFRYTLYIRWNDKTSLSTEKCTRKK
jgi:hypothetical protein